VYIRSLIFKIFEIIQNILNGHKLTNQAMEKEKKIILMIDFNNFLTFCTFFVFDILYIKFLQ